MGASKYALVTAGIAGAVFSLAGCTTTTPESVDATVSETAETWTIGQQTSSSASYLDDKGELTGPLPELVAALQGPLGLTINQEGQSWENILLGVEQGTYEFAPAAAVLPERLEKFDFAVMQTHVYSFRVKNGNPPIEDSMDAICGLSIGLPQGASAIPSLEAQSAKCEEDGAEPIDIRTFADWGSADLAVQSGQIDAVTRVIVDMEVENAANPGVWTITGPTYFRSYAGLAVQRGSESGQRLVDALNALIDAGEYQDIFDRNGLGPSAVEKSFLITKETYEVPE